MKALKLATVAILLAFGTAVAQEVGKKMAFKIVVDGDSPDQPNVITWSSDGADLDGLAIGESRTLNSSSGNEFTVTKTEAGMEFHVNGEAVVVPDMGQHGTTMAFVNADGMHEVHREIDVEVMAFEGDETVNVRVMKAGTHATTVRAPDGVTIISGVALDDSVKESIRSVLISAGHDEEIRFLDGSNPQVLQESE